MKSNRDYSIDFFKAVTVISILFIHTVWWSGSEYIPKWVAQLSLLIDVPLFFFLSGCSATFSFKKEKPFSGIVRLIVLFTIFYFLYGLFYHPNYVFDYFFSTLFFNYLGVAELNVFGPSLWFVPVFIVVYLVAYTFIKHFGKRVNLLILNVLSLSACFFNAEFDIFERTKILAVTASSVLAYISFFLSGYFFYAHKNNKYLMRILYTIVSGLVAYGLWFLYKNGLLLQENKFPVKFPYVAVSYISVLFFIVFSQRFKFNFKINFIGRNALVFYLAQGITSSWLFLISPHINFDWPLKMLVMFLINFGMATIISIPLVYLFNGYLKFANASFKKLDNL